MTGIEFENLVKPYFEEIFDEMGFTVFDVRNQNSGTQNGFDIIIEFLDDANVDRQLCIECKFYESKLYYEKIMIKVLELAGSNYSPDGFIALSPKENLSNIHHNVNEKLQQTFKFPIEFWTPDFKIEEFFALKPKVFEKIYGKKIDFEFDRTRRLNKVKAKINFLLKRKDLLQISDFIEIENEENEEPNDGVNFKTNLDEKLNAVFDEKNEIRLRFHQYRCDYKLYIEKLEDVNNILRDKILKWQDNLRIKAERLTHQFKTDPDYTPIKFYNEFFHTAENSLKEFYKHNSLYGADEKLLHGVVLELAAECPLDWRKN